MAKKIIKAQMKQRRDTLENWAAVNPVLLDGELGFIEGFNDRFKVGDGKTAWNDLSYFSGRFNPSGTYPDLTAGDLAGRGESVPASFGFRASGGKSIKDGRAYIKRIKGNSVVWNQLALKNADSYTASGVTATWDGEKIHLQGVYNAEGDKNIYSMIQRLSLRMGHKYALILRGGQYASFYTSGGFVSPSIYREVILEANGEYCDITLRVDALASAGQSIDEYVTMQVTDLTQMFQAGNEPTTIEEFNARVATLGIDMYAYNEGQVIHCNTERIKSVGDNAVSFGGEILIASTSNQDEVKDYQVGYTYVGIASSGYANADRVSKCEVYDGKVIVDATSGYGVGSFLEVLPNAEYHINASIEGKGNIYIAWYDAEKRWIRQGWFQNDISPYNARYAMCCLIPENSVVFSDIMLTLVHSGWKQDTDAGYQPYWQDTLPLPIISKYFSDGMKKAGAAHDEIRYNKASGKWEAVQRIGSVDMGTLSWAYNSTSGQERFFTIGIKDDVAQTQDSVKANLVTSRYITDSFSSLFAHISDKLIAQHSSGQVVIYDSAYTDAASFKAAMAGVMLYYELAEPIVTEITEDFRDYYNVADFGTEMSQSNNVPSAAFSADIIYQFNAVDMIREHEAEINELQKVIATMQAQLTSLINK